MSNNPLGVSVDTENPLSSPNFRTLIHIGSIVFTAGMLWNRFSSFEVSQIKFQESVERKMDSMSTEVKGISIAFANSNANIEILKQRVEFIEKKMSK